MESVVEGLLYVQGDLGITLKDIERILGIDEEGLRGLFLVWRIIMMIIREVLELIF